MNPNLPAIRQIPGLSAERAAAAHDLLSWVEAAPVSVPGLVEVVHGSLAEDHSDLDGFCGFVSAEMDDLGNAGIVWEDDEGNSWLHICEPAA